MDNIFDFMGGSRHCLFMWEYVISLSACHGSPLEDITYYIYTLRSSVTIYLEQVAQASNWIIDTSGDV